MSTVRKLNCRAGIFSVAILIFSIDAFATPAPVTISTKDPLPQPRWIYSADKKPESAGRDVIGGLQKLKSAQLTGAWSACLDQAAALKKKAKGLDAWIEAVELDCAAHLPVSVQAADRLAKILEMARKNSSFALTGAAAPAVRNAWVKAVIALIESDSQIKRGRVWTDLESNEDLTAYMDDKTKARYWRLAGEHAFLQQKPEAAIGFFRRSLQADDNDEVRARLKSIVAAPAKPDTDASDVRAVGTEASAEEIALADRVTEALKSGEFVPAIDDAIKIIRQYPGSTRAKWATDRAFEAYVSIVEKAVPKDPNLIFLRERVRGSMLMADADRLADWARSLYGKGLFPDAFEFAKKALDTSDGAKRTRVLETAAQAAIAIEDFDSAAKWYREIVDRSAGQPTSREALLHLGLVSYRRAQYPDAVADFERLLSLGQIESTEVAARYWLWRSLQKMKSDRAGVVADDLMKKYPFTYYGLRARYERNAGILEWKPESAPLETQIWLSGSQRLAWEKFQLLLRAGWLDEAQAELQEFPAAIKSDEKAMRALMWLAAGGFVPAAKLVHEAWDDDPSLRRPPFMNAAFPREFSNLIGKEADERGLDRDLVRGLIKQESGYNVKAVSSSNALGLMQMIPPTAREIAQDLKLGTLDLSKDMFEPSRNIKMGTYYLSRMVKKYQGYVPLALAAYNAGPARMDRWLGSRASMKDLMAISTSDVDQEIWIDEIPYSETCFYVKAILRNLLMYKMLENGRVEVKNPVWSTK